MAISFRKKTLEKLSSPEELDTVLTITSPGSWAALITIGFCLVTAVAWGVWGRVPSSLSGSGILLNPKGIFSIPADNSGSIRTINVDLGDTVIEGETLAVLSFPGEEEKVIIAKKELAALEEDFVFRKTAEELNLREKELERDLAIQELELNSRINRAKVERLNKRIVNQEELLKLGLITQYDLTETIEERDSAKDRVATDETQITSTRDAYEQAVRESDKQIKELEAKIRQAKEDLEEKELELKTDEKVVAPYGGIIIAVAAQTGTRVTAGEEMFLLERLDNENQNGLICRQYYPAATAKRIKVGMVSHVAPGTVEVDQYGYLLAKVTSVASFPSTSAQLQNELQNDKLVRQITEMGTVLAVESVPIKSENTPSGYAWTSSQGPPYSLDKGTPATTSVIIEEIPPISLVIPILKKYLLGIGEERS